MKLSIWVKLGGRFVRIGQKKPRLSIWKLIRYGLALVAVGTIIVLIVIISGHGLLRSREYVYETRIWVPDGCSNETDPCYARRELVLVLRDNREFRVLANTGIVPSREIGVEIVSHEVMVSGLSSDTQHFRGVMWWENPTLDIVNQLNSAPVLRGENPSWANGH